MLRTKLIHLGTPMERVHAKYVIMPSGCWIWNAAVTCGTPVFSVSGDETKSARRYLVEAEHGPVRGYVRPCSVNKLCVNPEHAQFNLRARS